MTTEANNVVRPIHPKNRMPVVIHAYDREKWLADDTPFEELQRMMSPAADGETHVQPYESPS
ncbi:MAG: SOS response-associated peptidase family protein [Acidobacteriota bacterium]|nr:MAG: SOS response-associated peptidase family protein [Acidobacteriota bacterium]